MKVKLEEKTILDNVEQAKSFRLRALGLMFKEDMNDMDGLLLEPCNSIHTFFMKFPIDVYFLNRDNVIVKIFRSIPPWRITRLYLTASKVLETEAGKVECEVQEGQKLEFVCIN